MLILNRLTGLVVGLALLAGGALVVGEVGLALAEQRPWVIDRSALDRQLSQLTWSDPAVIPIAVALLLAGLVLLVLGLTPGRPAMLPLASTEHRRATIDRRSVEARLKTVAATDDDVLRASARVGRRRARVAAVAEYGTELTTVQERVREAVGGELTRLGLPHPLRLKVSQAPQPR